MPASVHLLPLARRKVLRRNSGLCYVLLDVRHLVELSELPLRRGCQLCELGLLFGVLVPLCGGQYLLYTAVLPRGFLLAGRIDVALGSV